MTDTNRPRAYLEPTQEAGRAFARDFAGLAHRTAALADSRLLPLVELPIPALGSGARMERLSAKGLHRAGVRDGGKRDDGDADGGTVPLAEGGPGE
jgi:hypothetical protein